MDDEEIALNTNFDSALFDCWDDAKGLVVDDDHEDENDQGDQVSAQRVSHISRGNHHHTDNDNWAASATYAQWNRFPSFSLEQDDGRRSEKDETGSSSEKVAGETQVLETQKVPPSTDTGDPCSGSMSKQAPVVSAYASISCSGHADAPSLISAAQSTYTRPSSVHDASTQLHPLAIQASANCPPHENGAGVLGGMPLFTVPLDLQNAALLPLAMNALAAGATLNNPFLLNAVNNANTQAALAAAAAAAAAGAPQQQQPITAMQQVSANNASTTTDGDPHHQQQHQRPPFLLFDAPVELRTNFQQTMRAQGLPVMYDTNSYHFGVSVNGFHPQALGAGNQNVKLVDARHGNVGEKRLKNVKEQRRAQKIAELIDELRSKMQKSGWSVGVSKSKYNTLSSCADYVKHLVKVTNVKEEAVRQARSDLETKRRKMEEEKSQQDPSDPESTTSSLTVSSGSAADGDANSGDKMRDSSGEPNAKKPKLCSHESTISSTVSSAGDDNGKNTTGVRTVSLDRTASCVSDITESINKGFSSNTDESPRSRSRSAHHTAAATGGNAVSDVSVADAQDGDDQANKRKSLQSENNLQSLATDFELDYREVFFKSNVPQLIATTAGKIIAYNDLFLAITGLSLDDVERSTIFNLVHSSKLSNLFEIVAKSLRAADPKTTTTTAKKNKGTATSATTSNTTPQDSSCTTAIDTDANPTTTNTGSSTGSSCSKTWNYEAMTLPCIRFPVEGRTSQLYITVTLMTDADPRKRCFHCVLTDCPCTDNGDIGRITPELLEMLFSASSTSGNNKHKKEGQEN